MIIFSNLLLFYVTQVALNYEFGRSRLQRIVYKGGGLLLAGEPDPCLDE